MAVARIRHGVVVTADARENRPKMKFDNNRVFEYAISFPDGLSGGVAAGRPQPLFHLVEKPPNLFNLQAIAGQQGVQDRVIEKVIERGLRSFVAHG